MVATILIRVGYGLFSTVGVGEPITGQLVVETDEATLLFIGVAVPPLGALKTRALSDRYWRR